MQVYVCWGAIQNEWQNTNFILHGVVHKLLSFILRAQIPGKGKKGVWKKTRMSHSSAKLLQTLKLKLLLFSSPSRIWLTWLLSGAVEKPKMFYSLEFTSMKLARNRTQYFAAASRWKLKGYIYYLLPTRLCPPCIKGVKLCTLNPTLPTKQSAIPYYKANWNPTHKH